MRVIVLSKRQSIREAVVPRARLFSAPRGLARQMPKATMSGTHNIGPGQRGRKLKATSVPINANTSPVGRASGAKRWRCVARRRSLSARLAADSEHSIDNRKRKIGSTAGERPLPEFGQYPAGLGLRRQRRGPDLTAHRYRRRVADRACHGHCCRTYGRYDWQCLLAGQSVRLPRRKGDVDIQRAA